MWSDHDIVRPHAEYWRRERPGSRSEKRIQRLIILCAAPRQLGAHKIYPNRRQKPDRFGRYFACGRQIVIVSDHMQSIGPTNGPVGKEENGVGHVGLSQDL
jgi:hypothetical protein